MGRMITPREEKATMWNGIENTIVTEENSDSITGDRMRDVEWMDILDGEGFSLVMWLYGVMACYWKSLLFAFSSKTKIVHAAVSVFERWFVELYFVNERFIRPIVNPHERVVVFSIESGVYHVSHEDIRWPSSITHARIVTKMWWLTLHVENDFKSSLYAIPLGTRTVDTYREVGSWPFPIFIGATHTLAINTIRDDVVGL